MPQTQLQTKNDVITTEQFKEALPKQLRGNVDSSIINSINQLLQDPELALNYRENLLSFTSVMKSGKYKITDYLNAVRFVSHRMLGDTNIESYSKVFPDRIAKFTAQGYTSKKISSFVYAYSKNQLVMQIYEQSLIPTHILNADTFQQAINVQVGLMNDTSVSPKVRSDAANSLLTHLKRPEAQKIELGITHKEDDATKDLREAIRDLADQQAKSIQHGSMNAKQIAHSQIIDAEVEEEEDEA